MKLPKIEKLEPALFFLCVWSLFCLVSGCASKTGMANRYPSVSTNAIVTGKPIEVPDKLPKVEKPTARIK